MRRRDRFRFSRVYTAAEAGRIAKTSAQNVRRWVRGYKDRTGWLRPVFGEPGDLDGELRLSFMQLCELIVVAGYREEGIRLEQLRDTHAYLQEYFGLEYPLASRKLGEGNGRLLYDIEDLRGVYLITDMKGQLTLPKMINARLDNFDFDSVDLQALRWFPHGRKVPVVVDPRFGAGLPTVKGRNLRVDVLARRKTAGQPLKSIAEEFGMTAAKIQKVLAVAA